MPRQVLLRAHKKFRGRERKDFIRVDDGDGGEFIAQLILFVTCTFEDEVKKMAYIRWFKAFGPRAGDAATGCLLIQPEKMRSIVQSHKMVSFIVLFFVKVSHTQPTSQRHLDDIYICFRLISINFRCPSMMLLTWSTSGTSFVFGLYRQKRRSVLSTVTVGCSL